MRILALLLPLLLIGCDPEGYDPESPWHEGAMGVLHQGITVAQAGGCSTGIVAGLSQQLIDEINCLRPGTLEDFRGNGIAVGQVVFPYLQGQARVGLQAAVAQRGGQVQINSALRTLAQQYLLYRWSQENRCGIGLAARPGRSRHESGLALDIQDSASWRDALENNGYRWFGANDRVHFDYVGGGTANLQGLSVQAFQRLWNRNNQGDVIEEDGQYGPQTEARLQASPAEGFPLGACIEPPLPVDMSVHTDPPPSPRDMSVRTDPPPPPPDMARPPLLPPDAAGPVDWSPPLESPDAAPSTPTPQDAWRPAPTVPIRDQGTPSYDANPSGKIRFEGGCTQAPHQEGISWVLLFFLAQLRRVKRKPCKTD